MKKVMGDTIRKTNFNVAKRYIRMVSGSFMTCMHGNGWILYKDRGQVIAHVDNTPDTDQERDKYCFHGNWWQNPSRI